MSDKKVKLRMGMHNRITKERWEAIKDDCNKGLPTTKIAKRHSVSEGTVRKVRRNRTYHEYRLIEVRNRKEPMAVIAPTSGLPFEDFGPKRIFFSPKKVKPTVDRSLSSRLNREAENTARAVSVLILGVVGVIVLALVIVFVISITKGGK